MKNIFLFLLTILFLGTEYFFHPIENFFIQSNANQIVNFLVIEEHPFRDLNKNKRLDPYEDSRLMVSLRVDDLLSQMTLQEKVGLMFHPPTQINGEFWSLIYGLSLGRRPSTERLIYYKNVNHFNFYGQPTIHKLANRLNELQKLAEQTRLGIPITFSSDPIHEVKGFGGIAASPLKGLSKWPSQLGFAAANDPNIINAFGIIASKEYRALGLHTALHPMLDLATEPRWARNFGTFGSSAVTTKELTLAYMDGFQKSTITENSVLTMVKHFPGGGPQKEGLDPHLKSGEEQVYPGNNFDYHLDPFIHAINNNLRVIMPYYGIPMGQTSENVAMAYNKEILTDLLRNKLKYDGVVCTDWGIISDRNWGVESLSIEDRYFKSIEAGVDQYGGESEIMYILKLLKDKRITPNRINESARRLLRNKFELGLFDNPYVDLSKINEIVNTPEHENLGFEAQKRSIILLKNNSYEDKPILPLIKQDEKIYMDGFNSENFMDFNLTDDIEEADIILVKLNIVFNGTQSPGTEKFSDLLLSTVFPDQNLNFEPETLKKMELYSKKAKLITVVNLNRPAILGKINQYSDALIGTFGVNEKAVKAVLIGNHNPKGVLPFEIPSSMSEVGDQLEDMPDDSLNPTFKKGFGLNYR